MQSTTLRRFLALSLTFGALAPTVGASHALAQATQAATATTLAPATSATSATAAAPTGVPVQTIVAAAKARVTPVYAKPGAAVATISLDNRKNFSGRHVFLVLKQEKDWIQVKVPARPNERTGWVKATDVTLYQHDYAIVISLSKRSMVVYKAGQEFMREVVAVGSAKYPTPTGSFFIRELARPANPRGAYGPWAFGLSGYSNVLQKFGRGDGQIGIHGTNAPKALGTAASHGCIRVRNISITKLAQTLPQGVPVEIVA